MPNRLIVTFMSGAEDGRQVTVENQTVSIGREERNDVVVPYDSRVSRRHLQIDALEDQLCLVDLGSRNGTYLEDGTRIIEPAHIGYGNLFRLGRTWLKVERSE
jgi:pSer/pThr/pTyr-binding forkhead associated (FHA) protein